MNLTKDQLNTYAKKLNKKIKKGATLWYKKCTILWLFEKNLLFFIKYSIFKDRMNIF